MNAYHRFSLSVVVTIASIGIGPKDDDGIVCTSVQQISDLRVPVQCVQYACMHSAVEV